MTKQYQEVKELESLWFALHKSENGCAAPKQVCDDRFERPAEQVATDGELTIGEFKSNVAIKQEPIYWIGEDGNVKSFEIANNSVCNRSKYREEEFRNMFESGGGSAIGQACGNQKRESFAGLVGGSPFSAQLSNSAKASSICKYANVDDIAESGYNLAATRAPHKLAKNGFAAYKPSDLELVMSRVGPSSQSLGYMYPEAAHNNLIYRDIGNCFMVSAAAGHTSDGGGNSAA